MSDVLSLAQEMQSEFDQLKAELDNQKQSITMRTAKVKKAEVANAEKEKQLNEWEKVLNKKYEEVQRMENAKFLEMKANQEFGNAQAEKEQAVKIKKETESLIDELKLRESEVQAREMALTEREKQYRAKIKQEIANKMAEQYLGK